MDFSYFFCIIKLLFLLKYSSLFKTTIAKYTNYLFVNLKFSNKRHKNSLRQIISMPKAIRLIRLAFAHLWYCSPYRNQKDNTFSICTIIRFYLYYIFFDMSLMPLLITSQTSHTIINALGSIFLNLFFNFINKYIFINYFFV